MSKRKELTDIEALSEYDSQANKAISGRPKKHQLGMIGKLNGCLYLIED